MAKRQAFRGPQVQRPAENPGTMGEMQMPEMGGMKKRRGIREKPGRSLVDVEIVERKPEDGSTSIAGFLYKPGEKGHAAQDSHERLSSWKARDASKSPAYKATVCYHGPDTSFRTEEINPHHYGRDYEPSPLKDYWKTGDKAEEEGLRVHEEYKYSEVATPGTVQDSGLKTSMAYGAVGFNKIKREVPDNRSFESQRKFRRSQAELEEDVPTFRDLDEY
jgi:hypothetical protein